MSLYSLPPVAFAAVAGYIGLLNLAIFARRRERIYLVVTLTSVAILLFQLATAGLYSATSLAEGVGWQQRQFWCTLPMMLGLVWLGVLHLKLSNQRWPWRFTWISLAAWGVTILAPEAVVSVEGLWAIRTIDVPILGAVTYHEASPTAFGQAIIGFALVMILWLASWAYRQGILGQDRRARFILIAIVISFLTAINDMLSQIFVFNIFYLAEYGFFIVFLMLVRAAEDELVEGPAVREARQRLIAELRQARKLEAIGRFAKGIAHELNNALTPVIGRAELALSALDREDPRREDLAEIIRTVERSREMSSQLLISSDDTLVGERHAADLNRLVRDAARLSRCLLREGVSLTLDLTPEPCGVLVAPQEINRVLVNLTINALEAMPEGGVLTFRTRSRRERVILDVIDDGVGMTEAAQARAFQPFFTTKPGGTGLGLASVKEIVEAHGARITLTSSPGEGTRFRLTFERARFTAPCAATPPPIGAASEGARAARIVVVEDDPHVMRLLARAMELHAYSARFFDSAEAALEDEAPLDLLLTDVMLPGADGWRLYEALSERCPGLPVLFISGYAGGLLPDEASWPRRASLLAKPFSTHELMSRISQLLEEEAP